MHKDLHPGAAFYFLQLRKIVYIYILFILQTEINPKCMSGKVFKDMKIYK